MAFFDNTAYIDEIYDYDCNQRRPLTNSFQSKVDSFLTGSAAEGAFVCRGVWETVTNIEMDIMKPFGKIPLDRKDNILVATNSIGYYHLRWNEDLVECLDPMYSDLLAVNDCNQHYLDSQLLKLSCKINNQGTYKDGTPTIFTDIDNMVHIEIDNILCIKLAFWPDFFDPWFQRKRFWPSPEILKEIEKNKCHLVLKSTPGSNRNDEWRISFSKAEVILSKGKSHFQNKCYLLAKFIYYANLKKIKDEKTDRHISSYLLKTTMLHMLEQTPPEHWKYWEERKGYCQVVIMLYERLAESLSKGDLPSYFTDEINLLAGYSDEYMKKMEEQILELCKMWSSSKGEEFFHSTVKELFGNVKNKMETPEAKLKSHSDFFLAQGSQITPERFLEQMDDFQSRIVTFKNESKDYSNPETISQLTRDVQKFGMSSMGIKEWPEFIQQQLFECDNNLRWMLESGNEIETEKVDFDQFRVQLGERLEKLPTSVNARDKEAMNLSVDLLKHSLVVENETDLQQLIGKIDTYSKSSDAVIEDEEPEPPQLTEEAQQMIEKWKPVYETMTERYGAPKLGESSSSDDECENSNIVNFQNALSDHLRTNYFPDSNKQELQNMVPLMTGVQQDLRLNHTTGVIPQYPFPVQIHQPHIPWPGNQNSMMMIPSAGQYSFNVGQNHAYPVQQSIICRPVHPGQQEFLTHGISSVAMQPSTVIQRTNHFEPVPVRHIQSSTSHRHNKNSCVIF